VRRRYIVRNADQVEPVPCPCGSSTRVITRADTEVASLHVTEIRDSKKHYHRQCTEYYFVLEGAGEMELAEDVVALRPGTTIVIPPGTPHRGRGDFRTLVVCIPALADADVHYCEEAGRQ